MSDAPDNKDQKWTVINALVRKGDSSLEPTSPQDKPLAGLDEHADQLRAERLDLLGRFKARSIDRKTALQKITVIYDTQLEAMKHALKRALEVENQKVDLIAKKYIYDITEEHLRDMQQMGIHNFKARMDTLLKLNLETAALMKSAEQQDVPEKLREMTLDAIIRKYKDFYARLMAEEAALG
jgi:hypothetical protein